MDRMIYLLDTNVISELSKGDSLSPVTRLYRPRELSCALAATVLHEWRSGVQRMPYGRKRTELQVFSRTLLESGIQILPYDREAALWHADERARLQTVGLTPAYRDGEIAAVAIVHDLTLVTRNLGDFRHFSGLRTENWFKS